MNCPGHTGECKFCKGKEGYPRSEFGMKMVNRQGDALVDFCCHHCHSNHSYSKKRYGIYESGKLGTSIPKGDQL